MDPTAAPSRAGQPLSHLRRVLLAAVTGAAWLTISGAAAQADVACTSYGAAGDTSVIAGSSELAAASGCTDSGDLPAVSVDGVELPKGNDSTQAAMWAADGWTADVVTDPAAPAASQTGGAPDTTTNLAPDLAYGRVAQTVAETSRDSAVSAPGTAPAAAAPEAADPAEPSPVIVPGTGAAPDTSAVSGTEDPAVVPGTSVVPDTEDPVVVPGPQEPVAPGADVVPGTGVVPDTEDPVVVPGPQEPAAPGADDVPGGADPAAMPPAAATPPAAMGASEPAPLVKDAAVKDATDEAATPAQPEPEPTGPEADDVVEARQASIAPVTYAALLLSQPRAAAILGGGSASMVVSGAGTDEPPASPGAPAPSPWQGGTGLPAPEALPPAPGSGSASAHSANGPAGTAAWMPGFFLYVPTTAADPIHGPRQLAYAAVNADPGSSPD